MANREISWLGLFLKTEWKKRTETDQTSDNNVAVKSLSFDDFSTFNSEDENEVYDITQLSDIIYIHADFQL